jgi:hypothetical protein
MEWIRKNILIIKDVVFYIICWTSGVILLILGAKHINLELPDDVHGLFLIFLAIGFLLLLLPFFKKVKFGTVELEREIQETKKEIGDLRTEVRQQFSILSTNINTIGNLSNQINLYLPDSQEIKNEITSIKAKLGHKEKEVAEITDELILPYEDSVMSLAKIRIRLEFLLRSILEKRLTVKEIDKPIKFLGLTQLIREFVKEYPQYNYLDRSFDYVTRVCNAGIHAQQVDQRQIEEVLQLGANIIATLNEINSATQNG